MGIEIKSNRVEFVDSLFRIYDDLNNLAKLAFQLSGLSSGTATITVQDQSGTLPLLEADQTWTNNNRFYDGSSDGMRIRNRSDSTKSFEWDASAITPSTVRTLSVQDGDYTLAGTNIINSFSVDQQFDSTTDFAGASTFHTSIIIEDPGIGTNTITIQAPTAPTSHTLTLPGANASGALTNNGSGTLSWAAAGGGGLNVGTATLNFSATPSAEASVAVTGQGSIVAGSHVDAFFMHETSDEETASFFVRLNCGTIVAGTGFTIYAESMGPLVTDTATVHWRWV